MKTLYLIPARGGSKGITGKNLREIAGKPLFMHTLDLARQFAPDADICLSTDDEAIVSAAEKAGYSVPFIRPEELASDNSGMQEVLNHALDFYAKKGVNYETLVLLQPTSPFRRATDIKNALSAYSAEIDMVVSVKETDANPYYVLFEDNADGFLNKSKEGNFTRRQDCPKVWQLNGAVYVMNVSSLREKGIKNFSRIRKTVMDSIHSLDLDTELDWQMALLVNDQYRILPHG
ncbi:MAG: acylneuraminate cytidylyltransferase family protein [Bacteroidetes bacterium HGW-Bacteroidetes-9]|nr:MAG: acylneuraminate cytidylyltransferase family protein [Bacteroidetes bacterium HGW-Bacteroidetes-9]